MKILLLVVLVAIAAVILATTDRGLYLLRWLYSFSQILLLWASGAAALAGVICYGFILGGWVAIFVPIALLAIAVRTLFGLR